MLVEPIGLVADDPLVRDALRTTLTDLGLHVLAGEPGRSDAEPVDRGGDGLGRDRRDGPAGPDGLEGPEGPAVFVWDFESEHASELHAAAAGTPVLALVDDDVLGRAAWRAGATGVVRRDDSGETLAAAVHAVAQGLRVFDASMADAFGLDTPTDPQLVPQLTPREHEVLSHLAGGLSNREIGEALGLSPHTAKFHVASILDKMGAETRTEAVVLAARWGLLHL